MSQFVYDRCPCGSGKKVKFCCCSDLVPDLEKILRMTEGQQRVAALDLVQRLVASNGPRAALLSIKAFLEFSAGQYVQCEETARQLEQLMPANVHALVHLAALEAIHASAENDASRRRERVREAVDYLQRVFGDEVRIRPLNFLTALDLVISVLSVQGELLAARAHLEIRAGLSEEDDPIWERLQALLGIPLPVLMKEEPSLAQRPHAEAAWRDRFAEVLQLEEQAAWKKAADICEELLAKHDQEPTLLTHLAVMRARLAQSERAAQALHRLAALEQVPFEEAVEREALAQLLDRTAGKPDEFVSQAFPTQSLEPIMERLLSDRRVAQHPIPEESQQADPPPKATFLLLDRPAPSDGDFQLQDIPIALGNLVVFGKQTDREARLELMGIRGDSLAAARQLVQEIGGAELQEPEPENVLRQVVLLNRIFRWQWYVPPDKLDEHQFRGLIKQQADRVIYEQWPQQPLPELDHQSPSAVAGQDAYRVRLAAAILALELIAEQEPLDVDLDFNRLREQLGVPPRVPIDPTGIDIHQLPSVRFFSLQFDKLSDEDLKLCWMRANLLDLTMPVYQIGSELLRREAFDDQVSPMEVWSRTYELAPAEQTQEILQRGHQLAESRKDRQLLQAVLSSELRRHIGQHNAAQAEATVQRMVQTRLMAPEQAAQFLAMLSQAMRGGQPTAGAAVQGSAAPQQTTLWTPESAAAAAPTSEKSKLWIPGRD